MNNYQQKRQELYIKAYELTHNEMTQHTRTGQDSTIAASQQAKLAVDKFDLFFPDPSPQNEAFEAMKRDVNRLANQLQDIRNLLGPIIRDEDLIPKIKILQTAEDILTRIEKDYKITASSNRYLVIPKSAPLTDKIVPERDTQHHSEPLPPEYLEHDLDCINNKCDPGCNDCGLRDNQKKPPAGYTGWLKDGTVSNKVLAYARNGKIYYGITVKGNWINTPEGISTDKTHVIAPVEEVIPRLKEYALELKLINETDLVAINVKKGTFLKVISSHPEKAIELLNSEGH